jgi:ribosomal protein S18 acetylase RimI-like enzyme
MNPQDREAVDYDFDYLDGGVNINHFIVDPKHRRRGVGSRVLHALVSQFEKDQTVEYIVVNMRGGDSAELFLRKNGFKIVDRFGESVTAELEFE